MERPGQAHEVDGWDAFVHVARRFWWVIVATSVLLGGATAIVAADMLHEPDCAVIDSQLRCTPHWTDWAGPVGIFLFATAVIPLNLLMTFWLNMRIGVVRPKTCPRCGVEGPPAHRGCRGWWPKRSDLDADVAKQRRQWAWHSAMPRSVVAGAVVLVAGISAVAIGLSSTPDEGPYERHCHLEGGERVCTSGGQPNNHSVAWFVGGFAAASLALLGTTGMFFFRLIRPTFRPADHSGPPGGW